MSAAITFSSVGSGSDPSIRVEPCVGLANKEVVAQVQSLQQHSVSADSNESPSNSPEANGVAANIPAEDDKPNIDAYRVAADLPRALYIPKIGVEAQVLHLGTTRDGAVAAPSNVMDAGWYKESAKPGVVLLDGHVHGPTKPGVFYDLKKLKAGDELQLERGDGKRFTYKIVQSKTYPADKVDMGAALTPITPGKAGLALITWTGELDKTNNTYKDRLVVFAGQL